MVLELRARSRHNHVGVDLLHTSQIFCRTNFVYDRPGRVDLQSRSTFHVTAADIVASRSPGRGRSHPITGIGSTLQYMYVHSPDRLHVRVQTTELVLRRRLTRAVSDRHVSALSERCMTLYTEQVDCRRPVVLALCSLHLYGVLVGVVLASHDERHNLFEKAQ